MYKNITQCTVTLTRNCNLRCSFCYAKRTFYKEEDSITLDQLKKVIDLCCESNVKYLVFTGGEPTLYNDLLDALIYIREGNKKLIPVIASNGLLFSDKSFAKKLITNGISYIDISLKGTSERDTIKTSGFNCWNKQMQAIYNLSELNVEFTCSLVLTKDNVNSYCNVIREASKHGAKQFSFTFMIDNEDSIYKNMDYLKLNNPFELIDDFMSKIDELNTITDDWWIEFSFPLCFFTEEQIRKLEGRLAAPCHVRELNGITFDTDLNLIPCNMFFDKKLEKFLYDFDSYLHLSRVLSVGRYNEELNRINVYPSSYCKKCKHLLRCKGGCPITWKNYDFTSMKIFKDNFRKGKIST